MAKSPSRFDKLEEKAKPPRDPEADREERRTKRRAAADAALEQHRKAHADKLATVDASAPKPPEVPEYDAPGGVKPGISSPDATPPMISDGQQVSGAPNRTRRK